MMNNEQKNVCVRSETDEARKQEGWVIERNRPAYLLHENRIGGLRGCRLEYRKRRITRGDSLPSLVSIELESGTQDGVACDEIGNAAFECSNVQWTDNLPRDRNV